MKAIKRNISIVCASVFFLLSTLAFVTSPKPNSTNTLTGEDCANCGSRSSCEEGGQDYGYSGCFIIDDWIGTPEGCNVYGTLCGGPPRQQ